ncbi:ferredoxin [Halobacteriales archaeon QS_5_70_15]|nr:MAG: ferredoxin [Halobacteriales archaeon QS_5_70_15]
MPDRHEVCPASELPPGGKRIVEVDGLPYSIGVFNVDGEYHALANVCPHQLAPLCEGRITGETVSKGVGDFRTVREGEVIQCPWHGWKFDIAEGTSVFNPHEVERVDDVDDEPPTGERAEASGTALEGEEPPVETYDVAVEEDVVVVYV